MCVCLRLRLLYYSLVLRRLTFEIEISAFVRAMFVTGKSAYQTQTWTLKGEHFVSEGLQCNENRFRRFKSGDFNVTDKYWRWTGKELWGRWNAEVSEKDSCQTNEKHWDQIGKCESIQIDRVNLIKIVNLNTSWIVFNCYNKLIFLNSLWNQNNALHFCTTFNFIRLKCLDKTIWLQKTS